MQLLGMEGDSYADGIRSEQRTAGILSVAQHRSNRVILSIPLGETRDIDQLVIWPGGVIAVITGVSSHPVRSKEGVVRVDEYPRVWLDSMARDAQTIEERLSAACRLALSVRPLVAVWSPFPVESDTAALVDGQALLVTLTTAEQNHPAV